MADALAVDPDEFLADVLAGLAQPQKSIPPKYFYDEAGSALFEAICATPEYYPTRAEMALLREIAPQLSARIAQDAVLVEFGSGASEKTRLLLDAAPQISLYAPIDISATALDAAVTRIVRSYPALEVSPVEADFSRLEHLPGGSQGRPVVGFFPGSTIGNLAPREAARFLTATRRLLGMDSLFIVGIDLVKDVATLLAAYDDAAGVTAAFNLNLLSRINRELSGDFDLSAFAHKAIWNTQASRIEMHLESRRDQTAHVAGQSFRFQAEETLHTENSHKFTVESFRGLSEAAGWAVRAVWVSPPPTFAVVLLSAGRE